MEFRGGDYGWNDTGIDRDGKHGGSEAVERFADDCSAFLRHSLRSGRAARRGELLHRTRRDGWRSTGDACENALHRIHRIERSGAANQRTGCEKAAGADVDQAHGA